MKKKSYNPFKMWGSYAGMLLSVLALYSISGNLYAGFYTINPEPVAYVLVGGVGFLIGYGIHSLIRKLRK